MTLERSEVRRRARREPLIVCNDNCVPPPLLRSCKNSQLPESVATACVTLQHADDVCNQRLPSRRAVIFVRSDRGDFAKNGQQRVLPVAIAVSLVSCQYVHRGLSLTPCGVSLPHHRGPKH